MNLYTYSRVRWISELQNLQGKWICKHKFGSVQYPSYKFTRQMNLYT